MKYTVIIQEPVREDVRPELERLLAEQMGLKPEQAQKLAARRSGRLLKPTTQARAERLRGLFAGLGVPVTLEEVADEAAPGAGLGAAAAQPAVSPAEGLGGLAAGSAAPVPAPASASAPAGGLNPFADPFAPPADPFGRPSDPFAPPSDPFAPPASPFATAADPFAPPADPFGGLGGSSQVIGVSPAASQVTRTAAAAPEAPASGTPAGADDDWSAFASALGASADPVAGKSAGQAKSDSADGEDTAALWADFADALRVDVPEEKPAEARPAPVSMASSAFLTNKDDSAATRGPRRSLGQQVLQAALVPLALSSLATLALLAGLIPARQAAEQRENAQAVASAFASNLDVADPAALETRLQRLVATDTVSFAQVKLNDGTAYFVSDAEGEARQTLQGQFQKWQSGAQGNFRGDRAYVVGEALLTPQGELQPLATGAAAQEIPAGGYQVSVGLPSRNLLGNILLPVLLLSLAALGLAYSFAKRVADALLSPIRRLVESAGSISTGDLSQPVRAEANDEIGDLAEALEKMRLSLSAAMDRLRRRKR